MHSFIREGARTRYHPDLAARYACLPLSALSSTTPRADLAAMRHETMPVRIFRT
jgi:urease accessory protein UreF